MELVVKDVSYHYKNKTLLNHLSFTLTNEFIYGLMGSNKTLLLEIIDDLVSYQGSVSIDGVTDKDKLKYRKMISLISQDCSFFTTRVIDEMTFILNHLPITCKDKKKKMKDALKMVGLEDSFLEREMDTLSETERILVHIACNLLSNPSVIIFDEVFIHLDAMNRKMLLRLIHKLKDTYGKIIVISSNHTNLLYSYTDQVLILKDGEIIKFDDSSKVFRDISFLKKNDFDVPYLVDFTDKARGKKVKLSYHKDILDLIKDVYKHV